MLIRKDPAKGGCIDKLRLIALLKSKLKILAKLFAKRLECSPRIYPLNTFVRDNSSLFAAMVESLI